MLVLVHIHHKADSAADDEDQEEGDPVEGLKADHGRHLTIADEPVARI